MRFRDGNLWAKGDGGFATAAAELTSRDAVFTYCEHDSKAIGWEPAWYKSACLEGLR